MLIVSIFLVLLWAYLRLILLSIPLANLAAAFEKEHQWMLPASWSIFL